MQINNPKLKLTFLESDTDTVITSEYIVNNSISFSEQLLNNLDASSNTVSLQITRNCPAIISTDSDCILKTNGDVKAVLYDDTTVLFTGYLNEKISWSVTVNGQQVLNIILEDVGTRLLPKHYDPLLDHVLEGTCTEVVENIAEQVGITVDDLFPEIETEVYRVVKSDDNCKDLLNSLLKECGYVYYFNALGKLAAKKIDCTTTQGIPEINKNHLYEKGGTAISLTKTMRKYRSARVSYQKYGTKSQALTYKDISGQSDTHPDCYIELLAGETYPDRENGTDCFVEATDLEAGKEVVAISNPHITLEWSNGGAGTYTLDNTIKEFVINILCTKRGAISKLQGKADLVYVDSDNIVIAGETLDSKNKSDNIFEDECKWLHDKTSVDYYANLIVNYYKFCSKQFVFYSDSSYVCGTIVKVNDNVFSGLVSNILITGRKYDSLSGIYEYKGVSISEFDFEQVTRDKESFTPPTSSNTKPGPQGEEGVGISEIRNFYKVTTDQVQPTPESITSQTIPLMDNINKYLWRKEVTVFTDGTSTYAVILAAVHGEDSTSTLFELTTDTQTYIRDLRKVGNQTVVITAHLQGYPTGTTCTLTTDYGELSTDTLVDNQNAVLTVPFVNDYDVITVTATSGDLTRTLKLSAVQKTDPRRNYGPSNTLLDDAIYIVSEDTTVNPNKKYYTVVDHIGYQIETPTGNPSEQGYLEIETHYIDGDAFVLQETTENDGYKSTIYVYTWIPDDDQTGEEETGHYGWTVMNTNFDYFDAVLSENIVNLFAGTSGNHVEIGQGNTILDCYKYLMAEHISAISYFIGTNGCIYSGCFDELGNRKPSSLETDTGFYVSDKGELKAHIATIDKLNATNATIIGGDINVSKLYCGDSNITGSVTMTSGSIDINTITTNDAAQGIPVDKTIQKDLYSIKQLYSALPDYNQKNTGLVLCNYSVNGTSYNQYAVQKTGSMIGAYQYLNTFTTSSIHEGHSCTIEEAVYSDGLVLSGTAVGHSKGDNYDPYRWSDGWTDTGKGTIRSLVRAMLPTLYPRLDWSQPVFVTIRLSCDHNTTMSVYFGDESSEIKAGIKYSNDTLAFQGWMNATDRLRIFRGGYYGSKAQYWRVTVNQGNIVNGRVIGFTPVGQAHKNNFTLNIPAGATRARLYWTGLNDTDNSSTYKGGFAKVNVQNETDTKYSYQIGSIITTRDPDTGEVDTERSLDRGDSHCDGCYLDIKCDGCSTISFEGYGGYNVHLLHFQTAFYCDQGDYVILKNDNSVRAMSASFSDSRDYFTDGAYDGSSLIIPATKVKADSLYNELINQGLVPGVEYNLDTAHTNKIVIDNRVVNITKIKVVPDTCVAYYVEGQWNYLNFLGYNYGGYYDSLSITFYPLTVPEGVSTKTILPKADNAYDLGTASQRWNDGHIDNIFMNYLTIGGVKYSVSVSGNNLVLTRV